MKTQDKEEIQYKQNDREQDKDGTVAAKLRDKLVGIMRMYNLLDYSEHDKHEKPGKYDKYSKDRGEYYANKVGTFKDKKLNKLWNKAEMAGFTGEELGELKKEFAHYDQKVEMYYKLIDDLDETIKKRYESKRIIAKYWLLVIGSALQFNLYDNLLQTLSIKMNWTFSMKLHQMIKSKTNTKNTWTIQTNCVRNIAN